MMEGLANPAQVIVRALGNWRPPPKKSLSEWANENFYLSAESSAQSGRWSTLPYQREPMDAITDPRVTFVTFMKSARVGYTKMINAAIGYSIDHDPCSMLVVQPTVEDAKGYSKEEIAPMLRDCPSLTNIVHDMEDAGPRDSGNTILHKKFPGGVLSLVGANSGAGFRRISRKRVFFDEVDAYPPSAGSDGDPIKLGTKRTEFFWDRKVVAGSTPLIAGASRIEQLFLEGDQRRFYVPCPHCGHRDFFVFTERRDGEGARRGHFMQWPEGKPEEAHFVCSKSGCVIEYKDQRGMLEAGEWRGAKPFRGHASFHIWTAYSVAPNATWAHIAAEFLQVKRNSEQLKTFVNTVLGETWQEQGEAPDWQRLYLQREHYPIATVPAGARFLTCGVDVQKDRFVYEIVGWAPGKESWSIDAGVLPGDTSREESWTVLDELLEREINAAQGTKRIAMMAIDAGYNTQMVYNFVRRHAANRVIAVKGVTTQRSIVGAPTPVDVHFNGRRIARGCKIWPVGVDVVKSELYGFLRLPWPTGDAVSKRFPQGFCHFPELGEDFFKQLTAEHLVKTVTRTGFPKYEWQVLPQRENHYLDARVYARAAASVLQLDRMEPKKSDTEFAQAVAQVATAMAQVVQAVTPAAALPVFTGQPAATNPTPKRERPTRSDSRFQFIGRRGKGWLR